MKTSFMHYMRSIAMSQLVINFEQLIAMSIAMSQLVINFEQFQPFKRQSNQWFSVLDHFMRLELKRVKIVCNFHHFLYFHWVFFNL